jgi:Ca-activated chloride channel family protein
MQLFRFANTEYLYLLLLLPVIILLWVVNEYRKKRALRRIGDLSLVKKLIPENSTTRPRIKIIIMSLTLISLCILLARPQFGSKMETVKRQGVEVIIALDVSNSMLAQDIQPA